MQAASEMTHLKLIVGFEFLLHRAQWMVLCKYLNWPDERNGVPQARTG
jgi:hypothetical protein